MEFVLRRPVLAEEPDLRDAIDGVLRRAYGVPSFLRAVELHDAVRPSGWVVAEADGRVVGVATGTAYSDGGFGWVGLVATAPEYQRRGLGTALTMEAESIIRAAGCRPVLDASEAGAPVYARMGYTVHGHTAVMVLPHDLPIHVDADVGIEACGADGLTVFDSLAFGADRSDLLRHLANRQGATCLRAHSGGETVGTAVVQAQMIGPIAAASADALQTLLRAAQRIGGQAMRIDVPADSGWRPVYEALGLATVRELRHMRVGIDALPGRRDLLAGQTSLGLG